MTLRRFRCEPIKFSHTLVRGRGVRQTAARMRTALQVISTGGMYGAERVLLELAVFLRDAGWRSKVLVLDGAGAAPLTQAAAAQGIEARLLSEPGDSWLGQARKLQDYFRGERIDIAHSHGYKPSILLHWLGETRRRACIATCHSWYSVHWRLKLYERLDKRAMRRFAHVVAVSNEIEADLLASGVARERVSYVANGLEAQLPHHDARTAIRRELGMAPDHALILRVGRLARSKGNDVLLRALGRGPMPVPWKLALLGDGEEQTALRVLAEQLGIAVNVAFVGFKSNVADYLAAADVFTIPSLQEGLPMVLLEAMAARCPCVVTDVGAIASVIENERSGLVVPPGLDEPLFLALRRLLGAPEERNKLVETARSLYERDFSRQAMGSRYAAVYEQVYRAARAASDLPV
jgi:glycosyltransferase involved in cell wall biosynthesis